MGCHGCGANDHWIKDYPQAEKKLKPPQRFYEECLVKHLFLDFLENLANMGTNKQTKDKGKAPL